MKISITIKKIEIHNGQEFSGANWKSPMQVIYTNKGIFLDNIIGKCFGFSNIKWKGIDWSKHVGQTVEIIIVNCIGKMIEPSKYQTVTSIEELKDNAGNHYRNCPNHNWAYPYFFLGPIQK